MGKFLRFNTDIVYNWLDWFIPIVFTLSFLSAFISSSFSILDDIAKLSAILLSVILLMCNKFQESLLTFKILLLLFLLSIFAYLYNGRPFECLVSDLFNLIPSMLFFLVGLNDSRANRNFYNRMMYVGSIILFAGIICYLTLPPWYKAVMLEYKNAARNNAVYGEESMLATLRFYCFFKDSYPVSLYSVYILSISLFSFFRRDKKIKYSLLCCLVSITSAVLCMHRVAIAGALILVILFLGYEFRKSDGKKVLGVIGLLFIVVICAYFISSSIQYRIDSISEMFLSRTEDVSVSSLFSERQGLSKKLMKQFVYPIFGHGIGSGGSTAQFLGYGGVTDASYVKLLFENGIMGLIFFLSLTLMSIIRGIEYFKYYVSEVSVLCFILLAMTGSNTLYMPYEYIIPFWYMMGKIWNKHYLHYAIKHKIHI